jgi:phosphotransferase system enzyme I (PtsI)
MDKVLKGIGVVPGTAVGKVKRVSSDIADSLAGYEAAEPARERERFLTASGEAARQIQALVDEAAGRKDDKAAAIMDAHLAMLADPMLAENIQAKIADSMPAPSAVLAATEEYAAMFAALEDEYLRERAADIRDIGKRVVGLLLGIGDTEFGDEPVILCAADIAPSVLATIPAGVVRGLVLEQGSTTSHVVIIAKSRGLITVVGIADTAGLEDGIEVVVDGTRGEVIVAPDKEKLAGYLQLIETERARYLEDLANASLPAVTADGRRVQLAANISSPADMEQALKFGCEGVGLYRSEFLFMERDRLPGEEEQFQAYRAVVEQGGGQLCIIRTLDIGGDKPLPYLDIGGESNPFLGWRAIRISLERTDTFVTQLKAILRAGAYGKVAVMLPMIINAGEIRQARQWLAKAADELELEDKKFVRDIPLGIMVETPAAAVTADLLAKECDFFSIGTNDLTQYTLAVDRGNQKVRKLYSHFQPAVLRLIKNVIVAGHDNGLWVGVCGEMAGDPLAAGLLVGLGIDELSMNGPAIPRVREQIRRIDAAKARALAEEVLQLSGGEQIRERLAEKLG